MMGLGPYYQVNNIANKQQSIKESTYKTIHAYSNQTKLACTAWGPTRGPADLAIYWAFGLPADI